MMRDASIGEPVRSLRVDLAPRVPGFQWPCLSSRGASITIPKSESLERLEKGVADPMESIESGVNAPNNAWRVSMVTIR